MIAFRWRESSVRAAFHLTGLAFAGVAVLGEVAAVVAGLALTGGSVLGSGDERMHHLFVWPAFLLSVLLVGARLLARRRISLRWMKAYLAGMAAVSVLMPGAGYWGGEMLLQAAPGVGAAPAISPTEEQPAVALGRDLFLMNCAHCHGDDARGTMEGPDLTNIKKSESRIASVVKGGIRGEMPRFDQKLTDADVQVLIRFLRSLKGRPT